MNLNLFDGEAYDTLEAALAFIDECGASIHFSDESSASSNESSSSSPNKHTNPVNSGTSATRKLSTVRRSRPGKPTRNRSRDQQKLELLQLCVQVQVLQQRVDEMQRKHRENCSDKMPQKRQDAREHEKLQELAQRCRKEREEAERENQYLRDLYAGQVATIEALKKLLLMEDQSKVSQSTN